MDGYKSRYASSYIFSRKPGDKVTISGPYGEFFINHSELKCYILVGVGMQPMRFHLYELFKQLKQEEKCHIGMVVDLVGVILYRTFVL